MPAGYTIPPFGSPGNGNHVHSRCSCHNNNTQSNILCCAAIKWVCCKIEWCRLPVLLELNLLFSSIECMCEIYMFGAPNEMPLLQHSLVISNWLNLSKAIEHSPWFFFRLFYSNFSLALYNGFSVFSPKERDPPAEFPTCLAHHSFLFHATSLFAHRHRLFESSICVSVSMMGWNLKFTTKSISISQQLNKMQIHPHATQILNCSCLP